MCSGLDPPILATPEPVPQSLARPSPHPVTHYSASQKVQALDIKPSVWVSIESRRCWGISVARMASKPDTTGLRRHVTCRAIGLSLGGLGLHAAQRQQHIVRAPQVPIGARDSGHPKTESFYT